MRTSGPETNEARQTARDIDRLINRYFRIIALIVVFAVILIIMSFILGRTTGSANDSSRLYLSEQSFFLSHDELKNLRAND